MRIVPIVNENDSVSVEEIEFGDNDTLSAIVSVLVDANLLVILTDIDGLYDGDPRKNSNANLISIVEEINPKIEEFAGGAGSSRGTGGMYTKISAGKIATKAGINMVIANSSNPAIIYDVLNGEFKGTLFSKKRED
jgi:glutamate 5-kinase